MKTYFDVPRSLDSSTILLVLTGLEGLARQSKHSGPDE